MIKRANTDLVAKLTEEESDLLTKNLAHYPSMDEERTIGHERLEAAREELFIGDRQAC